MKKNNNNNNNLAILYLPEFTNWMIILINLEPLHAGRHAINIANYINNSLDMARKYARIFVRGHYLFREAKLFPRGKLEENYELRGTAKGKYPGIFSKSNGAYCAYHYPSKIFFFRYTRNLPVCQSRQSLSVGSQRLSTFISMLSNRLHFS